MPDLFVAQPTDTATPAPKKPRSAISSSNEKKKKPVGFFSSFCPNPSGVRVQNQEHDEEILLFLRRHFIKNLGWILISFFLILVPPLIFFAFQTNTAVSLPLTFPYLLAITATYYLFVATYAFIHFIEWFYNVGIVTNHRVVDVDFLNLLYKDVAAIKVSDILDAEYKQGGFFTSFFDYGTITLQTEALSAHFEFTDTPKPADVVEVISDLTQKEP